MPQVTQSMVTTWNNKASKAVATTSAAGLMSAADKKKLDNLAGGGSGGISGDYVVSVNGKTGVVLLAKADVGLGNVDNTADAQKEVLSATKLKTARNLTIGLTGKTFDGTTDVTWTLAEIGAAEKEHTHNYEPANVNIQSHISNNNNPHSVTKTQVGLGNVVNVDTSNPANIAWSANYRTVTDTEKTTWNGKQNALGYTAENSANKKTAWQATPDNTSYPSEKLVKDSLGLKVDKVTGKQLSTEDYTTTEKTKLSGIAVNANNYVHPTGDGNSHVPATGTTNSGKVLKAGTTANSASWGSVDWSEVVNKPTTFTATAHTHAISEVTNLQTTLDAKVNISDVVTTATASKILKLDANAKLPANITGNADGNAATATKLQTARTINGVSFDGSANITINAVDSTARIASSEKGAINGVATLDSTGKVPSSQLPSYVDDVLEYTNYAGFPATGETGKIYVNLATNRCYRWSGSAYVYITSGAVDSVNGKTGVVTLSKSDVGLGNVVNVDTSNPANITWTASYRTVTDAEKATWNGKQNALGYTAENSANKKTAWQATPDNTSYPSEKLVKDSLGLKVDKVTGKQLSTEDYTTAEKTKLSGIAAGANNYVHPTGDGNSHVPATGTTNSGKVLKAGSTANSARWGNIDWSEILNKPTSMPASDVYAWAKAANKPSYTASEVGAAQATHTHAVATTFEAGLMSASDKSILENLNLSKKIDIISCSLKANAQSLICSLERKACYVKLSVYPLSPETTSTTGRYSFSPWLDIDDGTTGVIFEFKIDKISAENNMWALVRGINSRDFTGSFKVAISDDGTKIDLYALPSASFLIAGVITYR